MTKMLRSRSTEKSGNLQKITLLKRQRSNTICLKSHSSNMEAKRGQATCLRSPSLPKITQKWKHRTVRQLTKYNNYSSGSTDHQENGLGKKQLSNGSTERSDYMPKITQLKWKHRYVRQPA